MDFIEGRYMFTRIYRPKSQLKIPSLSVLWLIPLNMTHIPTYNEVISSQNLTYVMHKHQYIAVSGRCVKCVISCQFFKVNYMCLCFLPISSAYLNLHYCEDAFNFKITGTCGLYISPLSFVFFNINFCFSNKIRETNWNENAKVRKFLIFFFCFETYTC